MVNRAPRAIDTALEAIWLVVAAGIPLVILHEDWIDGFIQVPKVFLLRSAAILMVALLAWKMAWPRAGTTQDPGAPIGVQARLGAAVAQHPARLVFFATVGVAYATLFSFLFSPMWGVSYFGVNAGWDSYGLANIHAYLIIFGVLATHLKTKGQISRLLWVIASAGLVTSLFGIGQHFGVDWHLNNPEPASRVGMTFGNPIFAGAFLLLTIPVGLVLALAMRRAPAVVVGVGTLLVASQVMALLFTLSRGPLVGLVVELIVFLAVFAWMFGAKATLRPLAVIGASLLIAFAISALPVSEGAEGGSSGAASAPVLERLFSGGGLSSRVTIWNTSADAFFSVPWADADVVPEAPSLRFKVLRPVLGFGPEMFGYAYAQVGESTLATRPVHGHNFIVHTAIELGLLGVGAYASLVVALGIVLVRMLRAARRRGPPEWHQFILIGLSTALVGRVVEQMSGKAQVSDSTASWMLAGAIAGMALLVSTERAGANAHSSRADQGVEAAPRSARSRPPRRARPERSLRTLPFPLVGAALLSFVAIFLWSQVVLGDLSSSVSVARSEAAAKDDNGPAALRHLNDAIGNSPGAARPRLALATGLLNGARVESDAGKRRSLLEPAHAQAMAVLRRNPMEDRGWATASQISTELARIDTSFVSRAIHESEAFASLYPGLWRPRLQLAGILEQLGEHARALTVIREANELGASTDPTAHYVEALALLNTGRVDEARSVAERLRGFSSAYAQELYQDFRKKVE